MRSIDAKPARSLTGKARFLIAEHDPAFREECRRCLAARGHGVEVAADGLQCIERLREGAVDVLVLDPEILWGGGVGVLDWLTDEASLSPHKVLVVHHRNAQGLPERFSWMVSRQLERPRNLGSLMAFVRSLEEAV